MRVVGGRLRGRALTGPSDQSVRPTSDRVRESVFNILEHSILSDGLEGLRVIDLFAGTGALGIEALSRGAKYCLFIDNDAASRALIRTNAEIFSLTGVSKIFRRDATDLGPVGTMEAFSVAFLDPPYRRSMAERGLNALRDGGWLKPGAVIVIEEDARSIVELQSGFEHLDQRRYGDTQVLILKFTGTAERL